METCRRNDREMDGKETRLMDRILWRRKKRNKAGNKYQGKYGGRRAGSRDMTRSMRENLMNTGWIAKKGDWQIRFCGPEGKKRNN